MKGKDVRAATRPKDWRRPTTITLDPEQIAFIEEDVGRDPRARSDWIRQAINNRIKMRKNHRARLAEANGNANKNPANGDTDPGSPDQ